MTQNAQNAQSLSQKQIKEYLKRFQQKKLFYHSCSPIFHSMQGLKCLNLSGVIIQNLILSFYQNQINKKIQLQNLQPNKKISKNTLLCPEIIKEKHKGERFLQDFHLKNQSNKKLAFERMIFEISSILDMLHDNRVQHYDAKANIIIRNKKDHNNFSVCDFDASRAFKHCLQIKPCENQMKNLYLKGRSLISQLKESNKNSYKLPNDSSIVPEFKQQNNSQSMAVSNQLCMNNKTENIFSDQNQQFILQKLSDKIQQIDLSFGKTDSHGWGITILNILFSLIKLKQQSLKQGKSSTQNFNDNVLNRQLQNQKFSYPKDIQKIMIFSNNQYKKQILWEAITKCYIIERQPQESYVKQIVYLCCQLIEPNPFLRISIKHFILKFKKIISKYQSNVNLFQQKSSNKNPQNKNMGINDSVFNKSDSGYAKKLQYLQDMKDFAFLTLKLNFTQEQIKNILKQEKFLLPQKVEQTFKKYKYDFQTTINSKIIINDSELKNEYDRLQQKLRNKSQMSLIIYWKNFYYHWITEWKYIKQKYNILTDNLLQSIKNTVCSNMKEFLQKRQNEHPKEKEIQNPFAKK